MAGDGFFTWVHRGILGAVPVSVCVTQEEHVEEELFPGNCNEGLRFRLLSIIVTSNKDAFLLPNLYDAMFLRSGLIMTENTRLCNSRALAVFPPRWLPLIINNLFAISANR